MANWITLPTYVNPVLNLFKQYKLEDLYKSNMTWNQALNLLYEHPRVIKIEVQKMLREHGLAHLYVKGMYRHRAWLIIKEYDPHGSTGLKQIEIPGSAAALTTAEAPLRK